MTKRVSKAANWLIVAILASMMFVQPNKANASSQSQANGCNDSPYGTYRGITTGSFWDGGNLFSFAGITTKKNIDDRGDSVSISTFTAQLDSEPYLVGPCTDTDSCTGPVSPDGTGTSACTIIASTCGDTGQTYSVAYTTDGNHIYAITSVDPSFQAFVEPTTLIRDCSE
jgi:hypothetical protein